MKKIIFFFLIFYGEISGQGLSNLWVMGYSCCQPDFGGVDINFSNDSALLSITQRYMNINCTVGSISDNNGNLLFISNGIYISNALDDTMQNGSGLNPSSYTTSRNQWGLAIPQANLIIPFPGDSTKYYLFHETSDDQFGTYVTLYLYYSIIDMSLDGGLGSVIQKNTVLLNDSLVGGRITGCKHSNGRDWWIFVHQYNTSMVYKYLISPQGISVPVVENVLNNRRLSFGQMIFSQQGNKFAYYEPNNDLDILDFNRCNGAFSNFVHVDINDSAFAGGIAFSSSGRFLYVSSENYIYQYDMNATSIDSSKVIVGVYDGYREQGFYQNFYLSSLAPDGKIYINTGNGSKYFHVINSPDSAGLACDFVQRGLPLPRWNAFTIPNYPNYFLGAEGGTVCDSLATGISDIKSPIEAFTVFPNPVQDFVFVNQSSTEPVIEIGIVNSLGQIEATQFISINDGKYLQVNMTGFVSGIYYLQMRTAKKVITKKLVRQ